MVFRSLFWFLQLSEAFFIPEEVRVQVEIFPFSAMGVLAFIFGIVLVAIVFAHYIGDKLSEGKY